MCLMHDQLARELLRLDNNFWMELASSSEDQAAHYMLIDLV